VVILFLVKSIVSSISSLLHSTIVMKLFVDSVSDDCALGCHGRGECLGGSCRCFPGYAGPSCDNGKKPRSFIHSFIQTMYIAPL